MKNIAVILAGGESKRFGSDKLLTEKFGRPVLFQTLEKFQNCALIDEIVLVTKKGALDWKPFSKVTKVLPGGRERFFSLENAIRYLEKKETKNCRVIVHNGANPFVTEKEICAGIKLAEKKKNVIFGFFTPNSIKEVQNGRVNKFCVREHIFESQTPQISDLQSFAKACDKVQAKKCVLPADEAELLAHIGEELFVFECALENQKITTEHDFPQNFRIGVGEDSHAFAKKFDPARPVKISGIAFPECQKTFQAHSDGDVILHALCNAILSSAGEKTLSTFADRLCEQGKTDSAKFVAEALKKTRKKFPRWEIQNVILSLECKIPRIEPRHEEIQRHVAKLLGIAKPCVGFTYTSGEALTSFGRGEGVRALVEILVKI